MSAVGWVDRGGVSSAVPWSYRGVGRSRMSALREGTAGKGPRPAAPAVKSLNTAPGSLEQAEPRSPPHPRPASRGRPAGTGEASRAGQGPREREALGVHWLTRLGYSFSTQSPHIVTQLTGTVRLGFREDETSRERREGSACALSTRPWRAQSVNQVLVSAP